MKKALIQLHVAVFLAGFTGILGRLIQLNEGWLVWYRMGITVVSFAFLLAVMGQLRKISLKVLLQLTGVGTIIALHWVTFYGSIKYANVSIALVCFSSIGFFTAIFEPILLRRKFNPAELFLGFLCIAGIYLIFNFNPDYKTGIILGIISALLAVLFSILNKALVSKVPVRTMTLYEMAGGFLVLTALLPFYHEMFPTDYIVPDLADWGWLLILAWVCTILAFILQLESLKSVSTFTSNLTYNLEPVYGILLAFVIYREDREFGVGFYAGLALIILAVVLQMYRVKMETVAARQLKQNQS